MRLFCNKLAAGIDTRYILLSLCWIRWSWPAADMRGRFWWFDVGPLLICIGDST